MSGDNLDEEFVSEEEAEMSPAFIKGLREKLHKAVEEKQKNLDGWQRAQAEFVNYKKQEAAMNQHRDARAKAELVEELLPALDSFELMLKHAQTKEMNLIHKQVLDGLRKMGVECFGKAGETFDPVRHEALREVPVESSDQDQRVVSVERSGYSIGSHIIRPAQVSIGQLQSN